MLLRLAGCSTGRSGTGLVRFLNRTMLTMVNETAKNEDQEKHRNTLTLTRCMRACDELYD